MYSLSRRKTSALLALIFLGVLVILGLLFSLNLLSPQNAPTATSRGYTIAQLTGTFDLSTAGSLNNLRLISIISTSTPAQIQTASVPVVVPTSIQIALPRFSIVSSVQISVNGVLPQDELCITLHPSDFWEPGDEADTLRNRLGLISSLEVDGVRIPSDARTFGGADNLMPVFDGVQGLLGSYSSWVEVCFSTADFALGRHIGTIQVITTAQRIFEYSWEFEIRTADN
jgi:hypothetical protein